MKTHPSSIAGAFLAIVLSVLTVRADVESTRHSELESIKAELESKRADYENLGRKEKDEIMRLRELEQQVALSGELLFKIKKESGRLANSISSQNAQLMDAQAEQGQRCVVLMQRLRYVYKVGTRPGWLKIMSSGNPTEALVAFKNMKSLLEYDRHLLKSYSDLSISIESAVKKLESDVRSLQRLQADQEKELAQREKTLQTRRKLVEKLRKDRTEVEKSIARLEEDAAEVAGILDTLRAKGKETGADLSLPGLAGRRGNLVWPTQGKIIRQFGLSKDKRGITLTNPGIDIQSKLGSDVVAAGEGVVIYVSWLRGYGQFIILDHGDGFYTLYANLSNVLVETGDHPRAGELIGSVGDSGSLEGPKLHFEIRHKKEQLNPLEWLR